MNTHYRLQQNAYHVIKEFQSLSGNIVGYDPSPSFFSGIVRRESRDFVIKFFEEAVHFLPHLRCPQRYLPKRPFRQLTQQKENKSFTMKSNFLRYSLIIEALSKERALSISTIQFNFCKFTFCNKIKSILRKYKDA
jgi:hypothetical protein